MTLEGLAELYFGIYSRERPPESRKEPDYFLNIRQRLLHAHIVHLTVLFYSDFSRCSFTEVFEKLLMNRWKLMIQRAAELRATPQARPLCALRATFFTHQQVNDPRLLRAGMDNPFSPEPGGAVLSGSRHSKCGSCARDINAQVQLSIDGLTTLLVHSFDQYWHKPKPKFYEKCQLKMEEK